MILMKKLSYLYNKDAFKVKDTCIPNSNNNNINISKKIFCFFFLIPIIMNSEDFYMLFSLSHQLDPICYLTLLTKLKVKEFFL